MCVIWEHPKARINYLLWWEKLCMHTHIYNFSSFLTLFLFFFYIPYFFPILSTNHSVTSEKFTNSMVSDWSCNIKSPILTGIQGNSGGNTSCFLLKPKQGPLYYCKAFILHPAGLKEITRINWKHFHGKAWFSQWIVCTSRIKTCSNITWYCRDHSVHALSQWEMTFYCNIISYWLSTCTKWSLI